MTGNNCIVRVKFKNDTTFMTDEVNTILHEYQQGKEIITICRVGRSISFNLDDIKMLQLYPKGSNN